MIAKRFDCTFVSIFLHTSLYIIYNPLDLLATANISTKFHHYQSNRYLDISKKKCETDTYWLTDKENKFKGPARGHERNGIRSNNLLTLHIQSPMAKRTHPSKPTQVLFHDFQDSWPHTLHHRCEGTQDASKCALTVRRSKRLIHLPFRFLHLHRFLQFCY